VRTFLQLVLFVGPVAAYLAAFAPMSDASVRGHSTGARGAAYALFAGYVIALALITLAPPPLSPSNGAFGVNLVPLVNSVRCFVPVPGQPPTAHFCIRTIAGNIGMFVPFGLMAPFIAPRLSSAKAIVVAAVATSAGIETLQAIGQLIGSARWADIDDVIFNVAGAMIGYLFLSTATRKSDNP
jgi:glycopeptide antibiotics resistance protein